MSGKMSVARHAWHGRPSLIAWLLADLRKAGALEEKDGMLLPTMAA
jgi:hypothetical protein